AAPAGPPPPAPALPEYLCVHDRLTALERLARLRDQGTLSAGEFAAEKAFILNLPTDELVLREPVPAAAAIAEPAAPTRPRPGPSLLGRLFGWKLVPVSLVAGLALSFATQPQDTLRFFDEALRLFGA
ncbi:MAG TPA: hypothetical protein VN231_14530, partial [Allosphingosinicella sp.]|nr:hypothetical protein [Allosphingosinicella sp.]